MRHFTLALMAAVATLVVIASTATRGVRPGDNSSSLATVLDTLAHRASQRAEFTTRFRWATYRVAPGAELVQDPSHLAEPAAWYEFHKNGRRMAISRTLLDANDQGVETSLAVFDESASHVLNIKPDGSTTAAIRPERSRIYSIPRFRTLLEDQTVDYDSGLLSFLTAPEVTVHEVVATDQMFVVRATQSIDPAHGDGDRCEATVTLDRHRGNVPIIIDLTTEFRSPREQQPKPITHRVSNVALAQADGHWYIQRAHLSVYNPNVSPNTFVSVFEAESFLLNDGVDAGYYSSIDLPEGTGVYNGFLGFGYQVGQKYITRNNAAVIISAPITGFETIEELEALADHGVPAASIEASKPAP